MRVPLSVSLVVGCLLAMPSPAEACSIPVFRYALERWKPTAYSLVLYHDGPISPGQKRELAALEAGLKFAPVNVAAADVRRLDPGILRSVHETHLRGKTLPQYAILYPESTAKTPPMWVGTPAEVAGLPLADSPARKLLADKLLGGETTVWLLLESADAQANRKAFEMLEKTLIGLKKDTELPKPTVEGPQLLTSLPLEVKFSILRVRRDDPAESLFVRMLTHAEEGLDAVDGPMVFPVFGQGRLLGGLHGKFLTDESVEDVVRYLCRACSCQVKEQNPGIDLLIRQDWGEMFRTHPAPVKAKK